jgi:hypothetical protein
MPPLWQYFSRVWQKRSRAHLGPQRARTPGRLGFPLQNRGFGEPREGAMIATMDTWQADAVVVGEGHCPVVAVLRAAA